ncbi:MAG: PepSY domain-containing protein [Paraglaciecola sp.]|uniref:PepSY domain-containing protein n=1 Tax=Pseudomonadati TaxID=3379134 RepID=UPI00273D3D40|nr:PepSY domain-containing protein [Paraglaciecola sp.]MDP5029907.1 PepSY domain-containing protein [Paraglaciecola sp.]MDP5040548.1 PepSY domain-containing protein [Paraglaciecola sp.]MDP5133991.1 PepSY domain-containing protein [Paraglaciecola sp.]
MASPKTHNTFRQLHRWLGFFLAGIMMVYASSGVLLIFRNTDTLKYDQQEIKQLAVNLNADALASELRLRNFSVTGQEDGIIRFNQGSYDRNSGIATLQLKDYPPVIKHLVKLHKATTNSPLYWLNISFGVTLLFFVISAFLMFMPRSSLFKNGLKIAGAGFIFAILVVIFGS